MIASLRRWHRRTVLLLAVLLPLLVILALAFRLQVPAVSELPGAGEPVEGGR